MADDTPTLAERARARRLELMEKAGALQPGKTWDESLIPQPTQQHHGPDELDTAIHSIGIVDAYVKWVPKDPPKNPNRKEVVVSCPNPGHPDANPSAWMNTETNVGNCAVCGGFDPIAIYAWNHGHPGDTYKAPGVFPQLKQDMATDLGFVIVKSGGTVHVTTSEDFKADEGQVIEIDPKVDDRIDLTKLPPIDWRDIIPDDSTFLRQWMETTSKDDLPEEFYFWLGLTMVGMAAGNDATIAASNPVRGNLMICLTGPSGQGKSRSMAPMMRLLGEALPYTNPKGVRVIPVPGSAEALVDEFVKPIIDPLGNVTGYESVRGILRVSEFAELVGKASRLGNTTKQTLMDLYDSSAPVATRSRGHGVSRADDHFCSVISSTQPRVMRTLLSDTDASSGFTNRWVFVAGRQKAMQAWDHEIIDIDHLIQPLQELRAWSALGQSIGIDPDALDCWTQFFERVLVPIKMDEDASIQGRIDLLFKKIFLLLSIDRRKKTVDLETMEAGLKMWPYLRWMYGIVEAQVGRTEEVDLVDKIEQILNKRGGSCTIRDIMRSLGQNQRKFSHDMVVRTLRNLVELGVIEQEKSSGAKGRPKISYRIAV